MSTPLTTRIAEEFAHAPPAPDAASATRRRAALAALSARGLPSTRDENWKYANLRPLERLRFAPAPPAMLPQAAQLPAPLPGFARYVFVDGVFAPALSASPGASAASVTALAAAPAASEVLPARSAEERLALLNEAFASDGALVRAGAPTQAEPARLELLFVASAEAAAGASYPRLELQLEPQARLELIERHLSCGADSSFVNSAVSVALGAGATLAHYRVQDLGARVVYFDTLAAELAREAHYRLYTLNTGSQSARSTVRVRLAGERAELNFAALSLGERAQVQDSFALIEHAAPNSRTEQLFRGIAAGRARVAFNGKIVVAAGAHGSDSRQSLRGLLAGPEAEIDVRPQLEIYTDDVRCSHGATAGKLDDNMLFYLLSRGLEPQEAQRLLKWAFLEDVVAGIEVAELRRQLEARLAQQLPEAPRTEAP
jgi:Fe-S cluster assembly protein SufD